MKNSKYANYGKNNRNYKDGKYCNSHYCLDCHKKISIRAKRCRRCSNKKTSKIRISNRRSYKGKNSSGYKDGRTLKKYFKNKIFNYTGCILVIHYRLDPIARLIQWVTKSKWNHVCWILNDQFILECSGKGTIISKRSKFANKALYATKIVKLREIDTQTLKMVLSKAQTRIRREKWAYMKLIYTMIAISLGFKGNRLICSSLIAIELSQVNWYFIKGKDPYLITPGDIARSKKTYPVGYTFSK